MVVLSILSTAIVGLLGLAALVNCIVSRRETKGYLKYGLLIGVLLLVIDFAILLLIPDALDEIPLPLIIVIDLIGLAQTVIWVCIGMYSCSLLERRDIPIIRNVFLRSDARENVVDKRYVVLTLGVVAAAVAYSALLFYATSPQLSETLRELSEAETVREGAGYEPSLTFGLALVAISMLEEIIYRLGVQNYVAKLLNLYGRRYWVAVVVSSSLWTLGHAGTLDPEWVKLAQVFPLGLALGFLFRKYGLEACVVAHAGFNVAMMFVGAHWVTG